MWSVFEMVSLLCAMCIFQASSEREYNVKVSYIEIYREELRDLLDLDTSSKDLHIREDDKGNTCEHGTPLHQTSGKLWDLYWTGVGTTNAIQE